MQSWTRLQKLIRALMGGQAVGPPKKLFKRISRPKPTNEQCNEREGSVNGIYHRFGTVKQRSLHKLSRFQSGTKQREGPQQLIFQKHRRNQE